jgi:hypothetical protein
MRIGNRHYTRAEVLERVGSIRQLGGVRRCLLDDGRSKGVTAFEVDTGAGFRFTVLPDRGLDISSASFRGTNLVHLTQNGEAHPAFYEPQGAGWLRTFFAGLLTTCGLTYLGPPGQDGEETLGLHGRATTTPARQVCDLSRWEGDEYLLEVTGIVEESQLFGDKIRLTRTLSTRIGSQSLTIRDFAENFGYQTAPFHILYHVNAGFPLLDACSRLVLSPCESEACDAHSAAGMGQMRAFTAPIPGFAEENFLHHMRPGSDGWATAAMVNPELEGGLALYVRFDARTLPLLNEWKMMGQGDYVVGIEPCNAPCENRAILREQGRLPFLEPGETREMTLEIGVLQGAAEIERLVKQMA